VRGEQDATYARHLGANEVVDVEAVSVESVPPVNVVIDTVGGEAQSQALALLARGGRLVSSVSLPDQQRAAGLKVSTKFMLVAVSTEALTRIAALLDAQKLTTNIGTVLPLADARVAHEMLEGARPRARGKIVLAVRPGAGRSATG
jgi:NADPH:quinone reductase-like Zn-dependent oxidoreductase